MISTNLKSIGAMVSLATATIQQAPGVVMSVGSIDQDYKDYGASFVASNKVAAFRVLADGTNPEIFASATPINSHFAITSAHLVTGIYANRQYELRLGSNFNSPTFTTSISNVFIHPDYDGTRNTPDLAVIQFDTPYEGISQANFGSAVSGELISGAGYGFAMRPGDPIPTSQDGFVRGWNSRVSLSPVASSDLYYNASLFLSSVSLGGKLLGGDSGSVSLNSAGQIIGLNTAQTGGIAAGGSSIYLDLTPGTAWVNWIDQKTAIPEPTGLFLAGAAFAAVGFRRRRN